MTTIKYNNLDTKYTIDTYNTFTSDSYEEMELQNINDDRIYNNKELLTYDDIDWNYNHQKEIELLANNSVSFIMQEVDKTIIQNMTVKDCRSPREYNFTTDSYTVEVEYIETELQKFIDNNLQPFQDYCKKACTSYDGYFSFTSYEDAIIQDNFKVMYYVDSLYTDDYLEYMYDNLYEVYMEAIDYKIKQ